jgi:hypothetical protein
MAISFIRILLLSAIFYATTYSSCKKGGIGCNDRQYVFNIGITASPGFDSIRVNDTLWFNMNESSTLTDQLSGQQVNFSGAQNLGFAFGIRSVISASQVLPAADSFSYFVREGINIDPPNPSYIRNYQLKESGGFYKLEVGLIAKKKGVYRVLVENSANIYTRDRPCDKATFQVQFLNPDPHFYLGYTTPAAGAQVYYFKVY